VIRDEPYISRYYWRRYASSGDPENPTDLAKKIDIPGNATFLQNGMYYTFTATENTQNSGCTLVEGGKSHLLLPKKTQVIDDVRATLMESGFESCTILFW
jgi:hypothetical protein